MTHTLAIPDFHFQPLNQLLGHWAQRSRRKKLDREMVAGYALNAQIPKAVGRRKVSLVITLAPKQRAADPDAPLKSCLDALTHAGLLRNDSRQWVEIGSITFERGPCRATAIILEDVP